MHKRITAFLLTAVLVLSMAACGSQTESQQSASAPASGAAAVSDAASGSDAAATAEENASAEASMQEDDILAKIDAVNSDPDSVAAEFGSLTLHYEDVQSGLTGTLWRTPDALIEIDSDGYVLVDEDGQAYGRYSEANDDYFKIACLNEADHQNLRETTGSALWYTSDLLQYPAAVASQDDGTLVVTLTATASDDEKTKLAEVYSAGDEEIQGFEYRLEVDPDTMLISRMVYSLVCGSMGILLTDTSAEYGGAKPEIPAALADFLQATDVRTVTMVVDPGTADEQTVTDTIRKGCSYQIADSNYDKYADAACTQTYQESADSTKDVTIYLKTRS